MLGVRGYGEHGSKRFNDYLEKVKEGMFSYVFPRAEKQIPRSLSPVSPASSGSE
jgi:hypothetical protein